MTMEDLKRVVWRLQELGKDKFCESDVRRAICHEIGTDERTIKKVIKKLLFLNLLTRKCRQVFVVGSELL